MLYFPYNAQELAKRPFDEFARPIFESLDRVDLNDEGADQEQALIELQPN